MRSYAALWSHTKVFLLLAGLTALLGAGGWALGGGAGLALGVALAAASNLALWFWSDRLVLRMYGARRVGRGEAPELYALVDRLRHNAGIAMPAIAIAPQSQPNAFATGRGERHAVVCVTEGLLGMLTREEIEGVVAHELAHIKQRDMLLMTIAATMAGAISNVANVLALGALFGNRDEEGTGGQQLAVMLVAPIAATLIQLAISRQREFRADALGAEIAGSPRGLASALQKLDLVARHRPMQVAPSVAPLAQVNPLGAASQGLARLFSTHPPTIERVARLNAMASRDLPRRAA